MLSLTQFQPDEELGLLARDVEHQCCWSKVTLLMYYTLYLQRSGTPSKRFKRSERSTPTAIVAPTRIDSLESCQS